ncbi:blue-sensitive opsin-like [Alligator sinensis]|uniref:Blue-sensitive opsin-like n=1 Tax=Alligator sinensis TaxID=38654 RepID=A0A3Q0HCT8_ALLSI|nr:blue-sensitive opsin-like [Alligator sinensis]
MAPSEVSWAELPDDFYLPPAVAGPNITARSPFLVPQTHLAGPGLFLAMATFMGLLVMLGVPLNTLTILCGARYRKLRSPLNYILVNLAGANLLVAGVGSTTATYSFAHMYFSLGPAACKAEGFTATLGATPLLFGWSRFIPEGLQCSCGPDWYTTNNKWNNESYVLFLFCFCFGLPLATIIFSYGRLLLTLRAVARQQEQSETTQRAEREVTRMVVTMVLGFLACWLPYASFALWVITHRGQPFSLALASLPAVFSKASTVYNPIIYVFMNKQFRACMLKLIFCGKSPFGEEDETSTASQSTQMSSTSSSQVAPA